MQLSLFQATLITGLAFLGFGLALLLKTRSLAAILREFPRSQMAAYVLMPIAMAWTLFNVTQLGEADFGNYKRLIFIGLLGLGLGAFKLAPDFLSVRAACILYLLVAYQLIFAAYMQYEHALRLLMVAPLYLGVAVAIYLAHSPFRLRDFLGWLCGAASRVRVFGIVLLAYGLLLSGIAFAF